MVENCARRREDECLREIRPFSTRPPTSPQLQLPPEREAEAQPIFQVLKQTAEQDLLALARLVAAKVDRDPLGKTEFEVRDRAHQLGAKALATAPEERKKGATEGRA